MSLVLVILMLMGAFVVDLGMQRVARADMQALADVVALDLARELDRSTPAGQLQGVMEAEAQRSLERNRSSIGYDPADPPELEITLGAFDASGTFVSVAPTAIPTVVSVRAATAVGFAFAGVTGLDEGGASRTALGEAESAACFQLGSYAASVKPAAAELFGDLMEQLIGQSTVGLAGYNGLATTQLSVLDVLTQMNVSVGTVDGLADTTVVLASFYRATAVVLKREGKVAEAQVLDWAADSVGDVTIRLGDLIGLTTSTSAALDMDFNVLDLLVGSAFLSNGSNFLDLANLQAGNSAIGWTNTGFTVIEKPRRACDNDEASTAQVNLVSLANLQLDNAPLLDKGPVQLRLKGADGKPDNRVVLNLDVHIAGARGRLTKVDCGPPVTFEADVWRDLITASLSGTVTLGGTVDVTLPPPFNSLVSVPVSVQLDVTAEASQPAGTQPTHVSVSYPPQVYGEPVSAGVNRTVLPQVGLSYVSGSLQTGPVKLLGVTVPTSVLDNAVSPLLNSVLPSLLTKFSLADQVVDTVNNILVPLQTGMGLTIAGADFFAIPTPQCGNPKLVG